jgi:hypothetical protein
MCNHGLINCNLIKPLCVFKKIKHNYYIFRYIIITVYLCAHTPNKDTAVSEKRSFSSLKCYQYLKKIQIIHFFSKCARFTIIVTIKVSFVYVRKYPHVYTNKYCYFWPLIYARPMKTLEITGYSGQRVSHAMFRSI